MARQTKPVDLGSNLVRVLDEMKPVLRSLGYSDSYPFASELLGLKVLQQDIKTLVADAIAIRKEMLGEYADNGHNGHTRPRPPRCSRPLRPARPFSRPKKRLFSS